MSVAQTSERPLAGGRIAEQRTGSATTVGNADAERKYEDTLVARAAIAGIAMQGTADGEWIATRWNLSRSFTSLDELSDWLDRATGAQPFHERYRLKCERRAVVDEANRRQDRLDEAADVLRGPGGERC